MYVKFKFVTISCVEHSNHCLCYKYKKQLNKIEWSGWQDQKVHKQGSTILGCKTRHIWGCAYHRYAHAHSTWSPIVTGSSRRLERSVSASSRTLLNKRIVSSLQYSMAGVPPPYTQNDPSAPIHGGYQQVPAKPQYGSAPSAPPYQAPYQPPTQASTHNTVSPSFNTWHWAHNIKVSRSDFTYH